jgi:hypothetical protein
MSRPMLSKAGIVVIAMLVAGAGSLAGQRGRGGGGHASRGGARTSVSSGSVNRSADVNRNTNVNRNANVNRNTNVNRDVNVDRDVDVDRRYDGVGGCCYHPVARTAAVTAAAVTTAAVGSVVYSIPASCSAVTVNGFTYQQCGSTWYQPKFSGSSVSYVVVNAPR